MQNPCFSLFILLILADVFEFFEEFLHYLDVFRNNQLTRRHNFFTWLFWNVNKACCMQSNHVKLVSSYIEFWSHLYKKKGSNSNEHLKWCKFEFDPLCKFVRKLHLARSQLCWHLEKCHFFLRMSSSRKSCKCFNFLFFVFYFLFIETLNDLGSLQERVVLFHVAIRGSFLKTARTFEAQVQWIWNFNEHVKLFGNEILYFFKILKNHFVFKNYFC